MKLVFRVAQRVGQAGSGFPNPARRTSLVQRSMEAPAPARVGVPSQAPGQQTITSPDEMGVPNERSNSSPSRCWEKSSQNGLNFPFSLIPIPSSFLSEQKISKVPRRTFGGSINTVPRLTSFFSFALASPPLRASSAHHTSPSDVCHCTKIYHAPKSAPAAFTGKEQHTASWPAMTGPNTAWWAALSNYWHPTTTLDHLCPCSTSMHSIACGESFAGAMQGCRTSTMLSQPSPSRR